VTISANIIPSSTYTPDSHCPTQHILVAVDIEQVGREENLGF